MTDTNTCATCDFYRPGNAPGHGTCHINPPGTLAHSGFPIIAASDWCSKGATGGDAWDQPGPRETELRLKLIDVLTEHMEACRAASRAHSQLAVMFRRNLWQRISNTVPWESDRNSVSAEDAKRHFDSPDRDKESPRR